MARQDPSNLADTSLLLHALRHATKDRLVLTLTTVIALSTEGRKIISDHMLTTRPDPPSSDEEDEEDDEDDEDNEDEEDEDADEDDAPLETNRGTKRRRADTISHSAPPTVKRKRFETCIQCDEEYDVTMNSKDDCCWHSDMSTICPSLPSHMSLNLYRRARGGLGW